MKTLFKLFIFPFNIIRALAELLLAVYSTKSAGKYQKFDLSPNSSCKKSILHLVPFSILEAPPYHGSSKDIANLEGTIFAEANIKITRLYCERGWRTLNSVLSANKDSVIKLYSYDLILINLPGKTGVLSLFLRFFTRKSQKIVARPHNAEFFHHLEMANILKKVDEKLNTMLYAFSCLFSDFITARCCHAIFCISRLDLERYWSKMAVNAVRVPYKPFSFRNKSSNSNAQAAEKILSIGSAKTGGTIALEQELLFYSVARDCEVPTGYQFCQTNAQMPHLAPLNVMAVPYVDNFQEFMSSVFCVVVCGKSGWGAKTKIVDAVYSGFKVVIDERLFIRLDDEYRSKCLAYGENSKAKNFQEAISITINNAHQNKQEDIREMQKEIDEKHQKIVIAAIKKII